MILAHGLGGRTDLPLPTWMVLYGGASALLISFAALVLLWPKPRWEGGVPGAAVSYPRRLGLSLFTGTLRALGLGAFLIVVLAAVIGENTPESNIAPVAVYVIFWVGLTFLCGLMGDIWRLINPFDTLALVMEQAELAGSRKAPSLGYWPAVAGLGAFLWLELVYPARAEPRVLAVAIIGYTALVIGAVAAWGREWLRQGEGFTVLFGLLAHVAPLRAEDGRLRLRPPFAGLAALEPERGLQAVVLVVLGSTGFDGLTRMQLWTDLSARYSGAANIALGTVGLLWAVAVVWGLYHGAMLMTNRLTGGEIPPGDLALAFIHSLVPIALAYSVAHYFSLFVLEGQAVIALASDPFGYGWNLFGTAGRGIDYAVLSPDTIAYVQAGAIVVGHIAGVVVAHDRALALFAGRDAVRSQYPLLGAMVLFTVGGLFLLLGG